MDVSQYRDEVELLQEAAGAQRPAKAVLFAVARENKRLRELQEENEQLRSLLVDHQSALEYIMQKYFPLPTFLHLAF